MMGSLGICLSFFLQQHACDRPLIQSPRAKKGWKNSELTFPSVVVFCFVIFFFKTKLLRKVTLRIGRPTFTQSLCRSNVYMYG